MRARLRGRTERPDPTAAPVPSSTQLLEAQECLFYTHDDKFNKADLLVNPNTISTIKDGDLLEVYCRGAPPECRIVLKATLMDRSGPHNFPFTMNRMVADLFNNDEFALLPHERCMIGQVLAKDVELDYAELTVKDQFVPRADLYRFLRAVNGSTAHNGRTFDLQKGVRAQMVQGNRNKQPVYSGVITSKTHVNLRSKSSRIFWLVQLSIEMYDYASNGDLHMEVFFKFIRKVLDRWRRLGVTHHLTVVYFSRTFFHTKRDSFTPSREGFLYERPVLTSLDGRLYEDVYKVVVHNETIPNDGGDALLTRLEREMLDFPRMMGWCKTVDFNTPTSPPSPPPPVHILGGPGEDSPEPSLNSGDPSIGVAIPSYASQGNFLEALNVTLNVLEKHYLDRDLTRSGNSIVTISAGTGVFEVDCRLSDITHQRMMDNGIGMDMVSLSQPPLHTAPLFIFKKPVDPSSKGDSPPHAVNSENSKKSAHGMSSTALQLGVDEGAGSRPESAREIVQTLSPSTETPPVQSSAVAAAQAAGDIAKRMPMCVSSDSNTVTSDQAVQAAAQAAAADRRNSSGSDSIKQEKSCYEVPHWMNLSFALAPSRTSPGSRGDGHFGESLLPTYRSVSSTVEDFDSGFDELPLPKLLDPPVMKLNKDGSLALSLPPVLSMLLGFRRHGRESSFSSVDTDGSSSGSGREAPRQTEKAHVWGNVEKVWPQPTPGIAGAVAAVVQSYTSPCSFALALPLIPGGQIPEKQTLRISGSGPWSSSTAETPPASSGGYRLRSPTRNSAPEAATAATANVNRISDITGTSPVAGYVGSPGSRGLNLEHLSRPFPDRDRNRPAPQATLRSSPKGNSVGTVPTMWNSSVIADGSREGPMSDSSDGTVGVVDERENQYRELFARYHDQVFRWKGIEPRSKYKRAQGMLSGVGLGSGSRANSSKCRDDFENRRGRTASLGGSATCLGSPAARSQELFPMSTRSRYSPSDGRHSGSDIWNRHGSPSRQASQTMSEMGLDSDGGSITGSPMPEGHLDDRLGIYEMETKERDRPRSLTHSLTRGVRQPLQGHLSAQIPGASQYGFAGQQGREDARLSSSPLNHGRLPFDGRQPSYSHQHRQGSVEQGRGGRQSSVKDKQNYTLWSGNGGSSSSGYPGGRLPGQGSGNSELASSQGSVDPKTSSLIGSEYNKKRFQGSTRAPSTPAPVSVSVSSQYAQGQTQRVFLPTTASFDRGGSASSGGGVTGMVSRSRQTVPMSTNNRPFSAGRGSSQRSGREERLVATTLPVHVPHRPNRNRSGSSAASLGRKPSGIAMAVMGSSPQSVPPKPGPARRSVTAGELDGISPARDSRDVHGRGRSASSGASSSLDTPRPVMRNRGLLRLDSIGGDRDSLEQRESRRNSAEGNSSGSGSGSGLSLPLRGTSVEPGINSPLSCSKGFAGEAEFNPFKKQDEKEVLETRTHNRRRWSHVFPPGQQEFRTMQGPIWRSLCKPALLPLSTDFVPSARDVTNNYEESNYCLMLQHDDSMLSRDVRPLLEEMCCQRLAQDFQLVERVSSQAKRGDWTTSKIGRGARAADHAQAYDLLARTAQDIPLAGMGHVVRAGTGRALPVLEGRVVYVLSMGHRLQTLTYKAESNTVSVKLYVQKGTKKPGNRYEYRYSLWLPQMTQVQTIRQTFLKFPYPDYNFNYVDSILSGYSSELNEFTRFRRLLFTIIPPEVKSKEDEDAFIASVRRLAGQLNNEKQEKFPDDMNKPQDPIEFEFRTHFGKEVPADPDAPSMEFKRKTVRMDLTASSNGGAPENEKPRSEWLDLVYDKVVDVNCTTQLDVRWLVCSGASVAHYVNTLNHRASGHQLRLIQVPEYATGEGINLHPLITHPYIQLPECSEADGVSIMNSIKNHLRNKLDFVRCRDVRTSWKDFGLKCERSGDLDNSQREQGIGGTLDPSGRVYCHRTGAAFVRVAPRGFVFLENLHWRDTANGQASDQRCSRPGKIVPQQLLNKLRKLVADTHFVHGLVKKVTEGAVDHA